jgi:hypothetical protein
MSKVSVIKPPLQQYPKAVTPTPWKSPSYHMIRRGCRPLHRRTRETKTTNSLENVKRGDQEHNGYKQFIKGRQKGFLKKGRRCRSLHRRTRETKATNSLEKVKRGDQEHNGYKQFIRG